MTRKLALLGFLPLVLLSGCSYSYDFVVVNRSAGVVKVQYTMKSSGPQSGTLFLFGPPAKVSLREFEKAEFEWQTLPEEQYRTDDFTEGFIVNLEPDEVLRVDSITNYSRKEDEFAIASIKLQGVNGSIDLEGKQAQMQFKGSDTKYVLTYR
jgi:hypothetical protein